MIVQTAKSIRCRQIIRGLEHAWYRPISASVHSSGVSTILTHTITSQCPNTSSTTTKQHFPSARGSITRAMTSATASQVSPHPLDPLSADEIKAASSIIRSHVGNDTAERLRFVAVSLLEPPKKEMIEFDLVTDAPHPRRMAEAIVVDPQTGIAFEYHVHLSSDDDDKVLEVVHEKSFPPGVQPMFTPEDCDLAEHIVQTSPQIAQILQERFGITDMSRVACDPWSVHFASSDDATRLAGQQKVPRRLVQTFLYYRQDGIDLQSNQYSHPISILPVVDLNAKQVVAIDGLDRTPPPPIPTASANYHRDLLHTNSYLPTTWRSQQLQTLNVVQPQGPSFSVENDNVVHWQKWSFRVGFSYREGLVLHNVKYDGRSIINRASLVEMAVPYADPRPPYTRKCAFDVGDYGLGYCANSLELGCDCLGHIHYFDGVVCDSRGEPVTKKKVICMHEEDVGILWKHVEYRNGHNESRRSRELVISFIATVVNYEYLFYWRLKQDGTIHLDIKLSGELSTNALSQDEQQEGPTHGTLVAPNVNAQIHQHMFCARLDMAVDGVKNTVSEVDMVRQEDDSTLNPYGNAFGPQETTLVSEKKAIRIHDASKARCWKIFNAEGKNNSITGQPVAYKLIPFSSGPAQPTLLVNPDTCTVASKGAFATANLWVTPHDDAERYPAGEFTPQGDGSPGLVDWTAQDRCVEGQDVVLWHAFGVSHVPRVEDFPVMPVEVTGFALKPDGFFDGNPAIDLEPEVNKASELAKGCCDGSNTE